MICVFQIRIRELEDALEAEREGRLRVGILGLKGLIY